MLFTSESVTEGHPDKLADQISDAVLDTILQEDPNARVACETALASGLAMVIGEITTSCKVDFSSVVRRTIQEVGYTDPEIGFDFRNCAVLTSISQQSPDIAQGVNRAEDSTQEGGAGDQGMMFGYATQESEDLLPLSISYAHKLARRLAEVRKNGLVPFFWPDGKTQVTVNYSDDFKVKNIDQLVISTQHHPRVTREEVKKTVLEHVVAPVIPAKYMPSQDKIYINPTGRFVHGGPAADAGLTGRKIIVDTYGGHGAHGGGAFSGKDPTKVDRSGAYIARYIAKNMVASRICSRILVQISYSIGRALPLSIYVNTYGSSTIPDAQIAECIREIMPLTPQSVIKYLDLKRPIYRNIAAYGHFGVDPSIYYWERTNKVDEIRRYFKIN